MLTRDEDSVRVDLVVDLAPQLHSKIVIDGVRCDTVEEILVNKLCALVGRSEIRDLVDLMWLERAGHSIEAHLEEATKKDGGFSPATAAWILSNVRIIPQRVPAGTDADELEAFRASIEARLRRLAFPTNGA